MMVLMIAVSPVFSQGDAPVRTIAELLLARDDGEGGPGDSVESFVTTDIPIYCIVMLNTDEPVLVSMKLIAVKVPGVKSETHVVTSQYKTKQGEDRVYFTGRPHGRWVAGAYRVDVKAGGEPVISLSFEIRKADRADVPGSELTLVPAPSLIFSSQ